MATSDDLTAAGRARSRRFGSGSAEPLIRVVICDDHEVVADGLAALLQSQSDIEIVSVTGDVEAVVAAAVRERPDVVLMDYELPGGNGIDATRRILDRVPETNVIMLTSFSDDAVLLGAIQAGATGFVTKHGGASALAEGVRLAAAGESVIAPDLLARLLPQLGRGGGTGGMAVTDREREILGLLATGASNQEIANALNIALNTVRNHLARIYARLGARSRLEAVAIAVREGIVSRH